MSHVATYRHSSSLIVTLLPSSGRTRIRGEVGLDTDLIEAMYDIAVDRAVRDLTWSDEIDLQGHVGV